jgi:hypothetical protein
LVGEVGDPGRGREEANGVVAGVDDLGEVGSTDKEDLSGKVNGVGKAGGRNGGGGYNGRGGTLPEGEEKLVAIGG